MQTHIQWNVSTGLCDTQFGMLQVCKNEISLRKSSGSSAQLRTLEGALAAREAARFDYNDSEPKSQGRLLFLLSLS